MPSRTKTRTERAQACRYPRPPAGLSMAAARRCRHVRVAKSRNAAWKWIFLTDTPMATGPRMELISRSKATGRRHGFGDGARLLPVSGPARYVVDPHDPRAPSQRVWDELGDVERARIVAALPSEVPLAEPPEGDQHRIPKTRALEALGEYFRRLKRRVYLSSELPVYYPGEPMFAPDILAVLDVEPGPRERWVVSAEGRGLDFALEICVRGNRRKDFVDNVARFARLGIPEYFAYDALVPRLSGFRADEW